ncbi:MAG TPA: 5-oxoprolinase subunit PxpA [Sporolactobacillaceae bacterium]|nr:5-oxoprolinase subunit PxpA [Sporolactobacillaceae bacterium]
MKKIDINCDLGESFGAYKIGQDSDMIQVVTSVNIACGFHAGDPKTMRETVKNAIEHGVGIGAHPGFPDLSGFGRRNLDMTPQEIYDMVIYQIGALEGFVRVAGGTLQHVKPHGALYNMAAKSEGISNAIAKAVFDFNPSLVLFGLSGSELITAGKRAGLVTASEVFADRTYQADGSLTSRRQPDAMIKEDAVAANQVVRMVNEGVVRSQQGSDVPIQADTVCIHGDGPHALSFAKALRATLLESSIAIQKLK